METNLWTFLTEYKESPVKNRQKSKVVGVFDFDRNLATFEIPRVLRAFSDIRSHVHGGSGNYYFFAGQLENLFRPSFQIALEEFGLPLQVSDKIRSKISNSGSLDDALNEIRQLQIPKLELSTFESTLLEDCQKNI